MISFNLNPTCPLCFEPSLNQDHHFICQRCLDCLPFIKHGCVHCGQSISEHVEYCAHCLKRRYAFDNLHACFDFSFPLQNMIRRYKYHQSFAFGTILSEFASQSIARHYQNQSLPECIIPIPLHPEKQKQRGYNQALEIAKVFSQQLELPIAHNLRKIIHTESQSHLPFKARQQNIRHSFLASNMNAHHVALIDDIATTCATVHEAAKALKVIGIQKIDVWCLARTTGH